MQIYYTKVGRVDEAIKWEEKVLNELVIFNDSLYEKTINEYKTVISQMKNEGLYLFAPRRSME